MASTIENHMPNANRWTAVLGVMFVFIGFGALLFPFMTTLTVEIFAGITLVIAGIATLVHAFSANGWPGFLMQLLIGALYTIGGLFFLINPLGGTIALTISLGFVFLVEGVARSIMAFNIKPDENWGWVFASGMLSILIGLMIMAGMSSGVSLAFIGIIFGINFVTAGISFIVIGIRKETPEPIPAA